MTSKGRQVEGEVVLSFDLVTKWFPGVTALQMVSFDVRAGEVHVLLGENGAGKSTLVNIIVGNIRADGGAMLVRGERMDHFSPSRARALGINGVLQDFSLIPTLTVAENLWLGRERTRGGLIARRAMRRAATEAFRAVGLSIDVGKRIDELSRAQQQIVEIVKALQGEPGVLILDEPTASLTYEETERLFAIVRRLRADNWAIVYISHRLEELRQIGDRVTVLRDGKRVATHRVAEVSDAQLVRDMTGRTFTTLYPRAVEAPKGTSLRVEHLAIAGGRVRDASITVRSGEIVGIAGLVGSGKSELARAIFGLEQIVAGTVEVCNQPIHHPTPRRMLAHGVVYLPQDRRAEALALVRPVRENVSLDALSSPTFSRFWIVRRRTEQREVEAVMERLDVRPRDPERLVMTLSGGNQQKVVLARALTRSRLVYLFDEPTSGVDVGAKVEIYEHMKVLCEEGAAIVLVSSDLEEVLHLAHRVYVMHRGATVSELSGQQLTQESVVRGSFGQLASDVAVRTDVKFEGAQA